LRITVIIILMKFMMMGWKRGLKTLNPFPVDD